MAKQIEKRKAQAQQLEGEPEEEKIYKEVLLCLLLPFYFFPLTCSAEARLGFAKDFDALPTRRRYLWFEKERETFDCR